jgi:serine/threonine-protein kinase
MAPHPLSRVLCKPQPGSHFEAGGRGYTLHGRIGSGAVGIVRKARDRASNRLVAVKFLAPDPRYIEVAAFDDVAERFRREGVRGAGLRHDNLVDILAYEDNSEGKAFASRSLKNPFIVMEHVRGRTVERLIRRLSAQGDGQIHITRQTLSIAARLTRALLHLHERKIVHRDVKPANIFVSATAPGLVPSELKLGDFGVTKWGDFLAATTTGTLTMSHQQGLGTLKYMSPEQAVRPKEVTVRSDMFSLGITLFELFSGQLLPSPHHVFEIMTARNMRGSVAGKLYQLGLRRVSPGEEAVFEKILDMFLNAAGRPTSKEMAGRFETWLERSVEAGQSAT